MTHAGTSEKETLIDWLYKMTPLVSLFKNKNEDKKMKTIHLSIIVISAKSNPKLKRY